MKKIDLNEIDEKMKNKGKTSLLVWQIVKFCLVSGLAGIIQILTVNLLYFAMRDWKAPLPELLGGIFSARTVGEGNSNWGYVLPFFLSNLIANVYGYIQNKKTTFKSDAPSYCFAIYIAILCALILFSTWLQGVAANALTQTKVQLWESLAPTIAAACAGTVQMLVLFPMEKFVLLKERK